MLSIKDGKVLLPSGEIVQNDVLVENGRISKIGSGLESESSIDACGGYVLPGLIDLHTHGLGYEAVASCHLADWAKLAAEKGVTAFYPTFFDTPTRLAEQMTRHLEETDDLKSVPQAVGFRLESPYVASVGGGMPGSNVPISNEVTQSLLDAGKGHIKIWDISPELENACDAISRLSGEGVICSMAHTVCSIEQAQAAVDAGMRLVTHMYDTFYPPEMSEPGVYPAGLTDYILIEDRLTCEIIGDGTHVHPILVEKIFKCKGVERVVFVTDSNMGAGLPPGKYTLPGGWGDIIIQGSNDGVRLADNMGLAGSALTSIDAFHNLIRMFGKDIPTARNMVKA